MKRKKNPVGVGGPLADERWLMKRMRGMRMRHRMMMRKMANLLVSPLASRLAA
jgi:hypothetical protein